MTLYQYLNIPSEFNLITDSFYAYGDKLVMFKRKFLVDNISSKLPSRLQPLSELLKIPVVLINTPIPEEHEIPHLIIKDKNGRLIYTEHIVEKPNKHIATPINGIPSIIKVRGLMLRWKILPTNNNFEIVHSIPKEKLLTNDNFNTIYPDGSKFDLTKYGEIVELLPKQIQL